jgi:S-formylglutathione hydrolase FrmB
MHFVTRLLVAFLALLARDPERPITISPAQTDANGFLVHEVESPYQSGKTKIRVFLPDRREKDDRFPVVYVLPVEVGDESKYGNGLLEVKKFDLANKHRAVFVAPTFAQLPWYVDHSSDPEIRQASYFLRVVVPAVEERYPARADAKDRLLVGFSKSGWGAWSLLLRYPDTFGKAAAWDAPFMMERPLYGMDRVVGKDFEKYRLATILEKRAPELKKGRLFLIGYGNFRDQHEKTHALLDRLGIRHEYRDGPARKHDWHSGWLPEAIELLFKAE